VDSQLGPRKHTTIYAVEACRLLTHKEFRTQPVAGKSYDDNNFGDSEELQWQTTCLQRRQL